MDSQLLNSLENIVLIIPAIDIKDKQCVRLYKGDYNQTKVYYNDPVEVAKMFEDQGARLIHLVDLDGAKAGHSVNLEVIKNIVQAVNIDLELGGGIRTKEYIEQLINLGIKRVILGTKVIEDIHFLDQLKEYQEHIIISVDLINENLSTSGWLKKTKIHYSEFLKKLQKYSINEVIVTDIDKDGTLEGPNIPLYEKMADQFPDIAIIVSGGISTLNDIKRVINLEKRNIKGIITGKAIYEKKINLKEALTYVS